MEHFIAKLPVDALPVLEWYLSKLVEGIRKRPGFQSMSEVISKRTDARFSALDACISEAVALVASKTMTADQALTWICKRPPHPAREYASLRLSRALSEARAQRRSDRNATIARMTREGYSNGDIASGAECSIATAAKIAAKSKRKETRPCTGS